MRTPSLRPRARLGLATLTLILTLAASVHGQDTTKFARYRTIDFGLRTGFASDREIFRSIWFRDALYGVVESAHAPLVSYFTTNGGRTWRTDSVPPHPQRFFSDGFAVASGGMVSYDSGRSWDRMRLRDDSLIYVTDVHMENRRFILCTATAPGFVGWVYSSDSGQTWKRMTGGGRMVFVHDDMSRDSTTIMEWPIPTYSVGTETYTVMGPQPMGICDDSILYCTSTAEIKSKQGVYEFAFLWRMNISTGIVSWRRVVDQAQIDTLCFRDRIRPIVPAHPFMETYWKEFNNPYPFRGFVLDSATWFVTGPYGLFARTSDAGQTWQRNDPAGRTLSLLAVDDRVLVGRDYGALLLSTDRGITWDDIGQRGGLPPRVGGILALARVSGSRNPLHLIAYCRYLPEPRGQLVGRFLESFDGGSTWRLLPIEGNPGFSIDPCRLFVFSNGESLTHLILGANTGFYFSTDGGLKWTRSVRYASHLIAMSDSVHGIRLARAVDGNAERIYRTTDAGRSWQVMRDSVTVLQTGVCRGFNTSSPDHAIVLWIYRDFRCRGWTNDAGATWNDERTEGGPDPHGAAEWIDSTNIVMVGTGGYIELSTDAGKTWSGISASPRAVPYGLWTYGNRMFVHSADFNKAEMWDLDSLNPASSPLRWSDDQHDGVRLISHDGSAASLDVPQGVHELLFADVLGRTRRLGSVEGPGPFTIDLGELPSHVGFLIVRSGSTSVVIPISGVH